MMADTAELTRRDGVELIRTGTWPISTGVWTATRDDLAAAVAAMSCPAIRKPVLKIGHNSSLGDGEPAIGRVENLRLVDGGHTLVGDYVGVPAWLNTIMASAYPDRSVEGSYRHRCQLGHTHPFALTAVALLGVTPPGVGTLKSLADVRELYGVTAEAGERVDEVRIAATVTGQAETTADQSSALTVPNMLMPVQAAGDSKLRAYWLHGEGAAKIRWGTGGDFTRCVRALREHVRDPEGLCAEYHHEATGMWPGNRRNVNAHASEDSVPNPQPSLAERIHTAWNASGQPEQQWIVEAADDEVIVMDNTDRSLVKVPVTVDGDNIRFGQPVRVRSAYVPDTEPVAATARMVFAGAEESRPTPTPVFIAGSSDPDNDPDPTPGPHNPAKLPVVVDDPQSPAASTADAPEPPAAEPEPATPTEPKEDPVSDLSEIRSRLGLPDDADDAATLAAIDALKSKAETPTPDPELVAASTAARDEMKTEIERLSGELATIKASAAADAKRALFDAAVQAGKLKPADREGWEARYDRAPDVISEILASIAPNTAVPVMASGEVTDLDTVDVDAEFAQFAHLFPPATSGKEN